ncbi:MAG: hypothetical protein ACYDG4_13225 [Desulfuromonadaceae bacterium]
MSTIFARARVNEIFYPVGKFENDTKRKFIHAPLDVLILDGEMYLKTRGMTEAAGSLPALAPTISQTDSIDEDLKSVSDGFFTELNPIVMGEHEFGNWQEHGNDWTGLHKLGFI